MKKLPFLSLAFVPLALLAQPADRILPVAPGNFTGPSPTEVTEETVVTFRYGAQKGSSTPQTYFGDPANNNFTWYATTERKVRIYLNDSILDAGISIRLNPLCGEDLLELSGVLYSLAGSKVNRTKLGRKLFEKTTGDGIVVYRAVLNSTFKNDIFELSYTIERPYVADNIVWYANELYGKGTARLEFQSPDYMDYDFKFMNLDAKDYTLKDDNKGGYMTIQVFGDEVGKWTLKTINISYEIRKKTFLTTQSPAPNVERGVVAAVTATKPVRVR